MYDLDLKHPIPLINWDKVFRMLSLKSFNTFYDIFRYPQPTSSQLQKIARDFVITFAKERNLDCSFTTSNNLSSGDYNNLNSNQIIFKNVFQLLKHQNEDKTVFEWANEAHHNYNYKEVSNLFAWTRLMRECTIVHSNEDRNLYARTTSEMRNAVRNYWIPIYRNNPIGMPDIESPSLTSKDISTLYDVVFEFEYERLKLSKIIEQLEIPPINEWDRFVFFGGFLQGWFSLEGKFRISLHELKTLVSVLNFDEIEIWGRMNAMNYENLSLPLPIIKIT